MQRRSDEEDQKGSPTQTNCWSELRGLRDFQLKRERDTQRERAGERDGRMRTSEKEQQRDPAEFMITLLKHMPAMVKPWHREHKQKVSADVLVWAHAVFVPVAVVCINCVNVCVGRGFRW